MLVSLLLSSLTSPALSSFFATTFRLRFKQPTVDDISRQIKTEPDRTNHDSLSTYSSSSTPTTSR